MPEFKFDIEIPPVTEEQTRITFRCGFSEVEIVKVTSGKHAGKWLPQYDWRTMYTGVEKERYGFPLEFEDMVEVAKAQVKKNETGRLIEAAKAEIVKTLKENP